MGLAGYSVVLLSLVVALVVLDAFALPPFALRDHYLVPEPGRGDVSNEELAVQSRWMWENDVNAVPSVIVNVQGRLARDDEDDKADLPLFTAVNERVYQKPTYKTYLDLMDNFIDDVRQEERPTPEQIEEQWRFVREVVKTPVALGTFAFMKKKGLIQPNENITRFFHDTWFTLYSRGGGRKGILNSSPFEHVFVGEYRGEKVLGIHNWLRFHVMEENKTGNYFGYRDLMFLGNKSAVGLALTYKNKYKYLTSFLIGTSPELELSLYTLCFYARPNKLCPVKCNGDHVGIQTVRMRESNYMSTAYPKQLGRKRQDELPTIYEDEVVE